MTCTRSLIRMALIAAVATVLLEGFGLAAPAAAQVIGPGSGRAGGSLAAVVALIGVVIGGLALARSADRIGNGGRNGAIVAMVLGLLGIGLAGLALRRSRRTG